MKKILNLFLICSIITLNATPSMAISFFGKNKTQTTDKEQVEKVNNVSKVDKVEKVEKVKKAKKSDKVAKEDEVEKVEIVKPDNEKPNPKRELKKNRENLKHREKSSKEAEGMYETKFPVINSQIEYADMNGEVSLVDCIKLAITHHPTIMSAISNAENYKTMIGKA